VLHEETGASRWDPFQAGLAEQFEVVLPDHPGFGRSGQVAWLDGLQDYVYYYLALLSALGLERVSVVGESFGGWLAALLAISHPERIEKLVLVSPLGLKRRGDWLPDLFAMSSEAWVELTLYDEQLAARLTAERPSREELERQLGDRATLARLAWNPRLHDPKLLRWLHRARVPTLLVWGREDRVLPPETTELWLEQLPEARLMVIEQAGHYPALERPDEVGRVVTEFLRQGS
jgi:pimeloyl-ACP methyl ester carboxylesterase